MYKKIALFLLPSILLVSCSKPAQGQGDGDNRAFRIAFDNGDVRAAIVRAQAKINEVETFINGSFSEISRLNSDIGIIEGQRNSYEKQTLELNALKDSIKAENSAVLKELEDVLSPQLQAVEQDIAEENHNIQNLTSSKARIETIQSRIKSNKEKLDMLLIDFETTGEDYEKWLIAFKSHVESNQPDFDSISDRNSYNAIILDINNVFNTAPSTAKLLNKESVLREETRQYLTDLNRLIEDIRQLASGVDLSTYRRVTNSDSVLEILRNLDQSKRLVFKEISRFNETIDKVRQQRELIQFELVRIWSAYATLKLHLLNIDDAVDLIAEIERILSSSDIFFEIRAKARFYSTQSQDLTGDITPFSAREIVDESLEFHRILGQELEKLGLSQSFKREIESFLVDFKREIDLYSEAVNDQLAESEIYLREWQRYVTRRLRRLGDNVTSECSSLADRIFSKNQASKEVEALYLKFRSSC